MKRILTCALAALMVISLLAGCGEGTKSNGTADNSKSTAAGSQANTSASVDEAGDLDLTKIYQALLDMQTNEEELVMFESSEDEINNYYQGLSDITFKQKVCYMAPVSGYACEVLLVETENSSDVKTVQEIFQKRIDDAANDTGYPETAKLWKNNAQVQTKGNYVGMIVLPDGYTIPDDIFSIAG